MRWKLFAIALAAAPCAVWMFAKPSVERWIAKIIADIAPKFLAGSKTSLGNIKLHIGSRFRIGLENLVIHNLDGWKSKYLLNLEGLTVTINVGKAIASAIKARGKPEQVEIMLFCIAGCTLMYEKGLTSSNLDDLVTKLKQPDKGSNEPEKEHKPETAMKENKKQVKVSLKSIDISGLEVVSTTNANAAIGEVVDVTIGLPIPLPPIKINDFSAIHHSDVDFGMIIEMLMELISTKAIEGLGGQVVDVGKRTIDLGKDVASNVGEGVADVGNKTLDATKDVVGGISDAGVAVADGATDLLKKTFSFGSKG